MIGIGHAHALSLCPSRPLSAPFVGVLDGLTDGLTVCWDIKRRLLASYEGASCLVRADRVGQPTFEVPFLADGTWDTAALLGFSGTDTTYLVKPHAQFGAIVFEQVVAEKQLELVAGGVIHESGAITLDSGDELHATLPSILVMLGAAQGHIYLRAVANNSGLQLHAEGGGVSTYADTQSSFYVFQYDYGGGGAAILAFPPGGAVVVSDFSYERHSTFAAIRVNRVDLHATGTTGTLLAGAALDVTVGGGELNQISSMVCWNTCDATLAGERNSALA